MAANGVSRTDTARPLTVESCRHRGVTVESDREEAALARPARRFLALFAAAGYPCIMPATSWPRIAPAGYFAVWTLT